MCGRFSQSFSAAAISTAFQVEVSEIPPHYNVAPSQAVAAAIETEAGARQLKWLRWGLIPAWAKDPSIGYKTINARAETAAQKPSFRSAFRHRRCVIPADGFYEWERIDGDSKRKKQPYFISRQQQRPLAFAGLYERWESETGDVRETCTILTTTANELMATIHDRMPVILAPQDYEAWLDPGNKNLDRLQSLLVPYPAADMQMYSVSTIVNNPRHNTPECQQPLTQASIVDG